MPCSAPSSRPALQFHTPEGQAQFSTRAASLLERDGNLDEAVALYLEGQDWKTATELILKLAPDFIAQGRGQTVNK